MLTFVTSEVLVIILTVMVLTVESNNECEDGDSIWPCNCEFDAWGVNNIHCKHDNWTAIKEALQKYSSACMSTLKISNDDVHHFDSALIRKIKTKTLILDFPNLVEIVGVMFQTRKRPAVSFSFPSGSFSKAPLNAIKHIAVESLTISNNPNVTRIERNEYAVLKNPFALEYLRYRNNSLRYIENEAFKMLTGLSSLFLSNNKLDSISPEILPKAKSLTAIGLSNNEFRRFPHEFVKFYISFNQNHVKELYFNNNNLTNEMNSTDWNVIMYSPANLKLHLSGIIFNCSSCALSPFAIRTNKSTFKFDYSSVSDIGGKCRYPEKKKNIEIYKTSVEDLAHCF